MTLDVRKFTDIFLSDSEDIFSLAGSEMKLAFVKL